LRVPGKGNFNIHREKPLVLVAPLDWGLGHATRCIPLIRALLFHGCEVLIACTATQKKLLALEFQEVSFALLPETAVTYGNNRITTVLRLLAQAPKFLIHIKREHRWLHELLQHQRVDAIISDNRFGFYADGIPCIFMTHQLQVKTGLGKWIDRWAQRINYRFINRFTVCWVPDYKGEEALAGRLSNPATLPATPVQYIGAVSRFTACTSPANPGQLLVILSGPEPQRSLLEQKIVAELPGNYAGKLRLVRGLPNEAPPLPELPGVEVHNHVTAPKLNQLICAAEYVISRSGYTTVMDLLKLKKKAILIPTPGQAEQEYLASHLHSRSLAYCIAQPDFSLRDAMEAAKQFPYRAVNFSMEDYKAQVQHFVAALPLLQDAAGATGHTP
jgi:UDP-N-acetylglucosamine transferase subunit ALG13